MTTPLTHGTNDNPSESGTTRCGLPYDPETRLCIVGNVWTRDTVLRATSLPPPCPTCFPVAGAVAELRGLAEAREALADFDARNIVPPCRICGKPLNQQSSNAFERVWACTGGDWRTGRWTPFDDAPERTLADEHYVNSQFDQRAPGLSAHLRTALEAVDALTLERDAYARQLAQERHTDARIARVKAIRQETGCGLKEALDIVNGDVALAATTARTLRDQALDALAGVDRLRAENEGLRAERDSARATERARAERILRALADAYRALHGGGGEYCHALATALDFTNQDERSQS